MEQLKQWKEVLAMIAMLFGGWFFIDARYAHATDNEKTHIEIQKTIIVNELRQLDAKKLEVKLKDWEELRYKDLERSLKELSSE